MRIVVAAAVLAVSVVGAAAQVTGPSAPGYTFAVTPEEANVVLNQLGEMKWKEINPLIQKLIAQLQSQNRPAVPPPPEKSPDPPKEP